MFKKNIATAPQREREGLTSHILLQQGDVPDVGLSVAWVEVAPGSRQRPHSHAPEQVYVIARGRGMMHVGDETQEVGPGDLIYIPPNVPHGIENAANETLVYFSAATPAFDLKALYDAGALR